MNVLNKLYNLRNEMQIDDLIKTSKVLLEKMQDLDKDNPKDSHYQSTKKIDNEVSNRPHIVNSPSYLSYSNDENIYKIISSEQTTGIYKDKQRNNKVTKLKCD